MATKGGKRVGAGRKKGAANKVTAAARAAAAAGGIMPLDFMLAVMRSTLEVGDASPAQILAFAELRLDAAKAAAPFCHAKLSSIEVGGKGGEPIPVSMIQLVPLK